MGGRRHWGASALWALAILERASAHARGAALNRPTHRARASAVGPLQIRLQTLDDATVERSSLEQIAAMFVESWFGDATSSEAQVRQLVDEIGADMRRRYSSQRVAEESRLVVALDEQGNTVGCAGVELLLLTVDGRLPASWSERRAKSTTLRPHMSNLAVSRSARRAGIASALVRACEDVAVEWGCTEQTLFVDCENEPAIALYTSLGYRMVSALQADKPVPRRSQQKRLQTGLAFAWVPTTNSFLVKSGLGAAATAGGE